MDATNVKRNIDKIYKKNSYLEKYGGSLFFTVAILLSYIFYKAKLDIDSRSAELRSDWSNIRCSPNVIPFAGMINAGPGESKLLYTAKNFSFCIRGILKSIVGNFFKPVYIAVNAMVLTVNGLILSLRGVRNFMAVIKIQVMKFLAYLNAVMNKITLPIKRIFIKVIDMIAKVGAVFSAVVYTVIGFLLSLKAFIAYFLTQIILAIIALVFYIIILWKIPFIGWTTAAILTIKVALIIIVLSVVVHMVRKVIGVSPGAVIPLVPSGSCFDEDTKIKMFNGRKKKIKDLKLGEKLADGSYITSKMKHVLGDQKMYKLDNILVTERHQVFIENDLDKKIINASDHPSSVLVEDYHSEFVYCLGTSNKRIKINNTIFTDWDDLDDMDLFELQRNTRSYLSKNISHEDIHKYLDGGFTKDTLVELDDGRSVPIKDVEINDVLYKGERVLGVIEINGKTINSIQSFIFKDESDNDVFIKGGSNLVVYDDNLGVIQTLDMAGTPIHQEETLYHLITDKRTLTINNITFLDYNGCIEIFLDNDKISLLSSLI
tara:strand:- start:738 stop:2372 length:1635 start_codon:yes stop_codon:yes gene_type:complete